MIKQLRDSFEEFVQEQTLGPGACGHRYIDLRNTDPLGHDPISSPSQILDIEIIDSVPAAYYSTGILFPRKDEITPASTIDIADSDDTEEAPHVRSGGDTDIDDDPALTSNQMYPTAIGMTFCVLKETTREELDLSLTYRYYTKIPIKDVPNTIGLLIEGDVGFIKQEIAKQELLRALFSVKELGESHYLYLKESPPSEKSTAVKEYFRMRDRKLAQEMGSDKEDQHVSGYKQFLFKRFRNADSNERKSILEKIEYIEAYECFRSHIIDLLRAVDSRNYGLWQCKSDEVPIIIPKEIPELGTKKKIIFNYNDERYSSLKDVVQHKIQTKNDSQNSSAASLSVNLQFGRETEINDRIFIKVQIVNTSSPFTQDDSKRSHFSAYNESVNVRSIFGVGIKARSEKIVPYNYRKTYKKDNKGLYDEDEITSFIYREYVDYGVGHGCSIRWDNSEKIKVVQTEYLPTYEVPDIEPIPRRMDKRVRQDKSNYILQQRFDKNHFLQFKWLSTLSTTEDEAILSGLRDFVGFYSEWIEEKRLTQCMPKDLVEQILSDCERDRDRMLANVDLLKENEELLRTFRLMNTAMFMQLWHGHNAKSGKIEESLLGDFDGFTEEFYKQSAAVEIFDDKPVAWRPFQLAFILLNVDGIVKRGSDITWSSRNEQVDLVWFPTGGGKTEAYLGIIAMTILFRRRLYGEQGCGTAVIMRYTLRLLTIQQFQRATLLVMALELIRRWETYDLGKEPIYIGLWVGQKSLPNYLDNENSDRRGLKQEYERIDQRLSKLKEQLEEFDENRLRIDTKIPFIACPWCGTSLFQGFHVHYDYIKDSANTYYHNRVLLKCRNKKCCFSLTENPTKRVNRYPGPIPVSLCDEEIYQHPPALLLGTVDKFAQLAHKASNRENARHNDTRRLFGRGNFESGKPKTGYLTPDLIVQDELHLLMGPLGSAVALMECAIDQLCTRMDDTGDSIRPKIISSTATTRNTDFQVMALFGRKVNIFPKPGLGCDDSFFAMYKRCFGTTDERELPTWVSKRKYMGILPTGKTQMWMQLRLAAIFLVFRAKFELSLLGGKSILDPDYSQEMIKAMDHYFTIISYFNSLREVGKTESQISTYLVKEMRRVFNRALRPSKLMHEYYTQRIHPGELTGRISGEEVREQLDKIQNSWSPEKKLDGITPPEFVVATNMISVGIDIPRLNTMIVNSMPRNIAEYIQATSRIGRETLGLVFTLHHPYRSRDVSHYEKYIEFHEKFYSYVEPISVTPFTLKALDRYLGLYLATMIRQTLDGFVDNGDAQKASRWVDQDVTRIIEQTSQYFNAIKELLDTDDFSTNVRALLMESELQNIRAWILEALEYWRDQAVEVAESGGELVYNWASSRARIPQVQLFVDIDEYSENIPNRKWVIPQSLRSVEPEAVINMKQI